MANPMWLFYRAMKNQKSTKVVRRIVFDNKNKTSIFTLKIYLINSNFLFVTDIFTVLIFYGNVGHHHMGLAISLHPNCYI